MCLELCKKCNSAVGFAGAGTAELFGRSCSQRSIRATMSICIVEFDSVEEFFKSVNTSGVCRLNGITLGGWEFDSRASGRIEDGRAACMHHHDHKQDPERHANEKLASDLALG